MCTRKFNNFAYQLLEACVSQEKENLDTLSVEKLKILYKYTNGDIETLRQIANQEGKKCYAALAEEASEIDLYPNVSQCIRSDF